MNNDTRVLLGQHPRIVLGAAKLGRDKDTREETPPAPLLRGGDTRDEGRDGRGEGRDEDRGTGGRTALP